MFPLIRCLRHFHWLLLLIAAPQTGFATPQVAVIHLAELPSSPPETSPPHPRVLTGEFRSEATTLEGSVPGSVIPAEYQQLVQANLLEQLTRAGIQAEPFEDIAAGAASGAPYLLYGAIRRVSVALGGNLVVSLRLIDSRSGDERSRRQIERKLNLPGTPFDVARPVHMVGLHRDDFHPQRMLLNHLAWQAGKEAASWLQGVIR